MTSCLKTFGLTDILPKDIWPYRHLAKRHLALQTSCQKTFGQKTFGQKHLPKRHLVNRYFVDFRPNDRVIVVSKRHCFGQLSVGQMAFDQMTRSLPNWPINGAWFGFMACWETLIYGSRLRSKFDKQFYTSKKGSSFTKLHFLRNFWKVQ